MAARREYMTASTRTFSLRDARDLDVHAVSGATQCSSHVALILRLSIPNKTEALIISGI